MGFISRILGIPKTKKPADPGCWQYNDGRVEVDLNRTPELSGKGGAIRLEGSGLPLRVLVFQGEDGEFHAWKNKCTHAGRRLDPLPGQPQVECCSVNKSKFEYDGDKKAGPAKGPVTVLPLQQEDGRLVIDLSNAG